MYLAVDIGGTKTLVAALNNQGVIKEQTKFPTPKNYDAFLDELHLALQSLETKDFRAGCVAVPGKIDRDKGIALAYGNLPWGKERIDADVERIAACPIVLENDAKLAGLSEAMLVKNYARVLYVTISTGIGTGVIVNGKIDPNLVEMEGGHIKLAYNGKLTDWEDFASGRAIVKQFGKRASEIEEAASWKIIARNIALGLIDLIAVIQPDVIILGGGVGTHFSKYEKYLKAELKKYEQPLVPIPPIRVAGRPELAVVYGCYDLAKERYGRAA